MIKHFHPHYLNENDIKHYWYTYSYFVNANYYDILIQNYMEALQQNISLDYYWFSFTEKR